MKLTKRQLKQIIKEELQNVLAQEQQRAGDNTNEILQLVKYVHGCTEMCPYGALKLERAIKSADVPRAEKHNSRLWQCIQKEKATISEECYEHADLLNNAVILWAGNVRKTKPYPG